MFWIIFLFCLHTFGFRRAIVVLDPKNQQQLVRSGSESEGPKTLFRNGNRNTTKLKYHKVTSTSSSPNSLIASSSDRPQVPYSSGVNTVVHTFT